MLARALVATGFVALAASAALAAEPAGVSLTAAQEQAMGLRLAKAQPAGLAPVVTLPATVTPSMNGRRIVAAPFAGSVVRVDALEGQSVKAGQALATVFSREALNAWSEGNQARAEVQLAESAAKRARMLAAEGIIAGARAEEAEAKLAQARAAQAAQQRLLSAGGANGSRPGEYVLRAPIAGKVAQINIQPGSALEAMAPAMVIDRDDVLWLEARLSPAYADKVIVGAPVRAAGALGKVLAVGGSLDPRSRTVVLRAQVSRTAGLMPGSTTSLTVMRPAPAGAVETPQSAVFQNGAASMVFIKDKQGYRPVTVTVVGAAEGRAVFTGVPAGTQVVASGVAQLKSALGR